jgi:hypothetical protein
MIPTKMLRRATATIICTPPPLTTTPAYRFGFNTNQGAVDGLWAGGTELATDFMQMVHQIRVLGFNAVRLPYT